MEESKIISHEIGHGVISYLFNEEYYIFDGIKLNPDYKLNNYDLAYTISKPVENLAEKVDQSNHLAAAVDGLLLLGGIAGLTVFNSENLDKFKVDASIDNYETYFDFEGSSGDFEIVNRGNRPYGWYLFKAGGMTNDEAWIRHVRILNLLKNVFRDNIILEGFKKLQENLIKNNSLTIHDFTETFNQEFVNEKRNEIKSYIQLGLGRPLLVA